MKNNVDENIEKLVKKLVQTDSIETPSLDFTKNVMSGILESKTNNNIIYQPIISKRGWLLISTGIIGVFTFLIFHTEKASPANQFNFSFLRFDKLLNSFSGFHVSDTTVHILLLAFLMISIQVILLKSYLNKSYQK